MAHRRLWVGAMAGACLLGGYLAPTASSAPAHGYKVFNAGVHPWQPPKGVTQLQFYIRCGVVRDLAGEPGARQEAAARSGGA
ncbi:hypothetical protein, partial [Streptomyces sp. URMC 124]|uniref:hypothetical protein n=1 Tax=Streptomyces sp. URMC 124 TaxID=3423405 RepID=UPI003F1BD664